MALLNTTSTSSFEKGGVPIVFKSNHCLSNKIFRSESRVSILLSSLYDCGLIVMRDSSNFKRYPIRSRDHGIITACGIDLRILVAWYQELKQKVDKVLEAQKKHKEALHYFRGLVRQIKVSYSSIEATPFTSLLFFRMQKIINIIGKPAKASIEKLHKAIRLFEWILQRVFKIKTAKTKYRHFADEMHIEYTTPNLICKCKKNEYSNSCENNQNLETTKNYEKFAYEKKVKGKTKNALSSKNRKSLQIKPELLTQALPNVAMFMKHGLQSENDLIGSMEFLAKMKGISSFAVEDAKKTMGVKKAALAIAIIFEKHCKQIVKPSGGYLRGMIDKENRGKLYLEHSFYALLNEASEEKLNNWRTQKTEKNELTKSNDQKSFLFKSELNKILKTLNMPKHLNQFIKT